MPRRAKLQRKSKVDAVADYYRLHPDQPSKVAAKDLKLTLQAVYSAKTVLNKRAKTINNNEAPLQERDIVAISKIGVATTERILRLLKLLEK